MGPAAEKGGASRLRIVIGEFDIIGRYFRRLTEAGDGSLALRDDAAVFVPPPGREIVATADAIVSGVHFLPDDPPDDVARKLLRVNLSDLASMGAEPLGYLMTATWPESVAEEWIARFTEGLAADQAGFGIALLGGDTTRTPGPLTLSLTALGSLPVGTALRRSGARPGDTVFVSGTVGDGVLGLRVLQGEGPDLEEAARDRLATRYRLPEPRLGLGRALRDGSLARAAIDVSDGLVADLAHITEESRVAAAIWAERVPLSAAAQAALSQDPALLTTLLTGGDDYELLITAAPGSDESLAAVAAETGVQLTAIGRIEAGSGVTVLAADGSELSLSRTGWTHF